MKIRPSQRKAVAKYIAAHYDRVELRLPKGYREKVKERARERGKSVNCYVNELIRADMDAQMCTM